MVSYFLNKLGYSFFTLFGVVTVVFILFNILPGDPARMMLDQNENSEQLALIKKKYGFDQPVSTQYLYYLNDLSPISFHKTQNDHYTFYTEEKYGGSVLFGTKNYDVVLKTPYLRESFQKNGKKVTDIILHTLPSTVVLAVLSIVIALLIGVVLGVLSAFECQQFFRSIDCLNKYVGYECTIVFQCHFICMDFWLRVAQLHRFKHDGQFVRSRRFW